MADPGLGQEKYKMTLRQLVPKSKEILKEWWRHVKEQRKGSYQPNIDLNIKVSDENMKSLPIK